MNTKEATERPAAETKPLDIGRLIARLERLKELDAYRGRLQAAVKRTAGTHECDSLAELRDAVVIEIGKLAAEMVIHGQCPAAEHCANCVKFTTGQRIMNVQGISTRHELVKQGLVQSRRHGWRGGELDSKVEDALAIHEFGAGAEPEE